MRYNISVVNNQIKESGLVCLDKYYHNMNSPMTFSCDKGHVFKTTFGRLKKDIRCLVCSGEISDVDVTKKKQPIYKIGDKVFTSHKEFRRAERNSKVPHEIAITEICNNIECVERYGFARRVLEELSADYIDLPLDVDYKTLKKEINEPYCGLCDECSVSNIYNCEMCVAEYGNELVSSGLECVKIAHNYGDMLHKVVPDAFYIDRNGKRIDVIEVEDTHRLNLDKILLYSEIYGNLDFDFMWDLNLILFDRFANFMGFIDLSIYEYCFWNSINQESHRLQEDLFLDNVDYCESVLPYNKYRLTNFLKSVSNIST